MKKQEIANDVSHIFESGANEIRVTELVLKVAREVEKEIRHRAAEIAISGDNTDQIHSAIMNLSVLK